MSEMLSVGLFIGKKAGMTRVYNESGEAVATTVIELIPNVVSQVKVSQTDGYDSYQIAYNVKREKVVNSALKGHLKKAGIEDFFSKQVECRVDKADLLYLGKRVSIEEFQPGELVSVTSVSKGKGFQGVIKRFHFSGGPASHGSHFHRTPGSIGNRATPARVFKLKKLPGHMGDRRVTVKNQCVMAVDYEKGYMLIKGVVPGATGADVLLKLQK